MCDNEGSASCGIHCWQYSERRSQGTRFDTVFLLVCGYTVLIAPSGLLTLSACPMVTFLGSQEVPRKSNNVIIIELQTTELARASHCLWEHQPVHNPS